MEIVIPKETENQIDISMGRVWGLNFLPNSDKKRGQSMFPFNTALYMCTELVIPNTVSIKCEESPGLSPKDLHCLGMTEE